MEFRQIEESDYTEVVEVIDEWWGGRPMRDLLPRLFFQHFRPTSYAAVERGKLIGFLIGFISQTAPEEAYIHFIGVHPDYRKQHVARQLYERFFECVEKNGCRTVHCITSPVNKASIAFHTRMGFEIEEGKAVADGVPVTPDYDGQGNPRVLFRYSLDRQK